MFLRHRGAKLEAEERAGLEASVADGGHPPHASSLWGGLRMKPLSHAPCSSKGSCASDRDDSPGPAQSSSASHVTGDLVDLHAFR